MDPPAPSRLNGGCLCNTGSTATEAEVRKRANNRKLIDNGYRWAWKYKLLLVRVVKISLRISVTCCCSHDDQLAGSFGSNGSQWLFKWEMQFVFSKLCSTEPRLKNFITSSCYFRPYKMGEENHDLCCVFSTFCQISRTSIT